MEEIVLRVARNSRNLWKTRAQRLWITVGVLISIIVVLACVVILQGMDNVQLDRQYKHVETELYELKNAPEPEPVVVVEEPVEDSIVDVSCLGTYTITYYCPEKQCSDEWGTQTATGVTAQEGITVAVDPKVIPYGTLLYIEGIGYRIAQDCGGAIKGNKIDVYVDSHNKENGIHDATVYIINMKEEQA